MAHRELLLRLHTHLKVLRETHAVYAPQLTPHFNALAWLGPDETRLSSIFKELLSPAGSHAQGSVFLKLFLERFDLAKDYLALVEKGKAKTEKSTDRLPNTMRRIDIFIDFGTAALAIENKPWSGDQPNQCRDYLAQLAISHPDTHCLIYLSASGNPPSEQSLLQQERETAESNGRFKVLAYPQLIEWLKDCRRESQSDRVSAFLSEFADYIHKQFVRLEVTELQTVVDITLESPRTLEAAFEIANASNEIRYRLLDLFEQQLRSKLPAGWNLEWHLTRNDYWARYAGFLIKCPEATLYSVCFEFKRTQCVEFLYGIRKSQEALPNVPDVRNCLDREVAQGKSSPWWPWYWEFQDPHWNWASSVRPWLEIQSGEMAGMIIEKTQAIYAALSGAGLSGQLGNPPGP